MQSIAQTIHKAIDTIPPDPNHGHLPNLLWLIPSWHPSLISNTPFWVEVSKCPFPYRTVRIFPKCVKQGGTHSPRISCIMGSFFLGIGAMMIKLGCDDPCLPSGSSGLLENIPQITYKSVRRSASWKSMNHSPTHTFKSRDASASKNMTLYQSDSLRMAKEIPNLTWFAWSTWYLQRWKIFAFQICVENNLLFLQDSL